MAETPPFLGPLDRGRHEILVVDDTPASRYATARLLRSVGFRTREAATGAEALRAADDTLSAMVLDVHLPDIDGFEICRLLRSRPGSAHLPVLHLSAAYVTDEDKVRGLDAGADAYLTHPVEPAVMVATVQALVRTRAAEQAMRHSEAKFRAIYELAPSGICLVDADGRIAQANTAMLALLGAPAGGVDGRAVVEFARSDWVPRVAACLQRPADERWQLEFPLVAAGGQEVQVDWRVAPLAGSTLRVALVTDVSERLQVEQARGELLEREQAARGEAERVGRLKDDLIAVLSHELRSPLNAIMGWTQVLQRREQTPETLRGLRAIERNGRTQARLLADILDASRINMGKLELDLEEVNPAQLLTSTLDALQPALSDNRNEVRLDVDADPGTVFADAARFQQIVWNLLSNAIKFSPPGAAIDVSLKRLPEGGVRLAVVDRGAGIDPKFLPHLFDRFTQGDTRANRHHGGLGLGLSIVKHLVELHGGSVTGVSEGVGRGAAFMVDLPGARPAGPGAGSTGSDGPETLPADLTDRYAFEELRGLRVLVVDDDADACATLDLILSERGASVVTCTSAREALERLSSFVPDVLISDLGMPDLSGFDLLRDVRRAEPAGRRLPAIALTGFNRQKDIDQTIAAGFDAHCPKPLRATQMLRTIVRLVGPAGSRPRPADAR